MGGTCGMLFTRSTTDRWETEMAKVEITIGRAGKHKFTFDVAAWDKMNEAERYMLVYGARQSIQDAAAGLKGSAADVAIAARAAVLVAGGKPEGRESDPTRRYAVEIAICAGIVTAKEIKSMVLDDVLKLVGTKRDQATADKIQATARRLRDLQRIDR